MATPLKNGVIIRYSEYGNKYLRADVYVVDGAFVFIGTLFYSDLQKEYHADVKIGSAGMERESNGYTMLIVPRSNVVIYYPWEVNINVIAKG